MELNMLDSIDWAPSLTSLRWLSQWALQRECILCITHIHDLVYWKAINPFSASTAAMTPMKKLVSKRSKEGKQVVKFTLDCTCPVEDGIMDANFE